jgi:hypothetical protein
MQPKPAIDESPTTGTEWHIFPSPIYHALPRFTSAGIIKNPLKTTKNTTFGGIRKNDYVEARIIVARRANAKW